MLLPIAAWWLAGRYRDPQGPLFITAAVCFASAVALNILNVEWRLTVLIPVIRSLLYATTFLMVEYFRRLLKRRSELSLVILLALGVSIAGLSVAVGEVWGRPFGGLLHHLFMICCQGHLLSLLRDARGQFASRGVLGMELAIALVFFVNIAQVLSVVATGVLLPFGSGSTDSVVIYFANFACVALYSLGYLALRAEIAQHAEVEMGAARVAEKERRLSAETLANASQTLVAERNRMILIQSRFEARNNLGLFNAAVIHEISQPLQKLVLDFAIMSSHRDFPAKLANQIQEINRNIDSMAGIVHSLRGLLSDVSPRLELVPIRGVVSPLRAITEGEASRRGIRLTIDDSMLDDSDAIRADSVLFGRIILNLISNAFNSLASNDRSPSRDGEEPSVVCEIRRSEELGQPVIFLVCRDNGAGPPAEFDASLETVVQSSTDGGMGIGLVLVKQLVAAWKGTLRVRVPKRGFEVSITLPRFTIDPG